VQWYGYEPAVVKVVVNCPPGAMIPEFQAPLVAVDVCDVLSLLVQVTLPPTASVVVPGENAVVVSTDAPFTIETGVPVPPPCIVVGDDEPDPQPYTASRPAKRSNRRFMGAFLVEGDRSKQTNEATHVPGSKTPICEIPPRQRDELDTIRETGMAFPKSPANSLQ